ncbi:hypothetical protein K2Z83_23000 [Oscillochloris sp. ZM17-4]|uniref:hypothetical protein n=1 Tax=Oscillochloris sp. ZM17-4 TaxID=2866714 RepID=UPI001C73595A|nr:hypothetical protein [Oscillochloris sp. ZM17-4]MBX0330528.1 hypothetical protein [Oscillochloris sp. ZM17-4]
MQISIPPTSATLPLPMARLLFAGVRLVPLWAIIGLSVYLITIGETLAGMALWARPAGVIRARRTGLFQSQTVRAATRDIRARPSIIVIDGLGRADGSPQWRIGSAHNRFLPYPQGGM